MDGVVGLGTAAGLTEAGNIVLTKTGDVVGITAVGAVAVKNGGTVCSHIILVGVKGDAVFNGQVGFYPLPVGVALGGVKHYQLGHIAVKIICISTIGANTQIITSLRSLVGGKDDAGAAVNSGVRAIVLVLVIKNSP